MGRLYDDGLIPPRSNDLKSPEGHGPWSVGWVLLIDALAESAARANPYTALTLALWGFVLLATLLLAVYGPPRGGQSR